MEWFDVDTWKTTWTTFTTSNNSSVSHEQNWACSSYAMARKSAMKWNSFAGTLSLRGPCWPKVAARETTMNNASPWTHFLLISPGVMSWRSLVFCCLPCSRITIRATACRLLLVVKVVIVVFPNSAGRIANSTNPITRFSGWTKKFPSSPCFRFCRLCRGTLPSVAYVRLCR